MDQLFLFVVESKDQRTEVLSCALGIGVPADDTVYGLRDLNLQPFAAAALFVATAASFGEDAFESFLFGGVKQGNSLPGIVVRIARDLTCDKKFLEHAFTLLECYAPQIIAIEIQKVESVVKHRQFRSRRCLASMAA